ncbi:MAG: SMP-30/gluconolactonase/LRE family protein [Kiritimatiellia bacterium]|jgi:sugar lactone lactonase YvrE|nr:SMP-30/gluconolactonase/LRE family protein [Kiritimatiellia bacterium]MDP6848833.1 SMP-30/gluconolactonase/LRE family protein [Kiritimatiellia bacterium]
MSVENVVPSQDLAGETPIWIPEEQAVYWIDMGGPRIHRYDPATGDANEWKLDVPITALARRSKGQWILATKTGLYFWDQEENKTEFIVDPEAGNADVRFNDGSIDPRGRFLIGTLNDQDLNAPDGSLYRLDPDLGIHKLDTGYAVANGIGFSPDGGTLYLTDMFNSRILAYDYDLEAGAVSGRRVFVDVPEDAGWPDGLIVDQEGFIWSAHWNGWRVTRYDPDGKIEREVKLPAANVTCMAFGGRDLNVLYITTAWFLLSDEDRAAQSQAGDLFRIETDVTGRLEPEFAG